MGQKDIMAHTISDFYLEIVTGGQAPPEHFCFVDSARVIQVLSHVLINPLRMRRRVTVVCLSVCMYVCMSVNAQTARVLISAIQTWCYQNRHDTYKIFHS